MARLEASISRPSVPQLPMWRHRVVTITIGRAVCVSVPALPGSATSRRTSRSRSSGLTTSDCADSSDRLQGTVLTIRSVSRCLVIELERSFRHHPDDLDLGNSARSRETRIQAVAMPAGQTTVTRIFGRSRWRSSEPARYIVRKPTSSGGVAVPPTESDLGQDVRRDPEHLRVPLTDLVLERVAHRQTVAQADAQDGAGVQRGSRVAARRPLATGASAPRRAGRSDRSGGSRGCPARHACRLSSTRPSSDSVIAATSAWPSGRPVAVVIATAIRAVASDAG